MLQGYDPDLTPVSDGLIQRMVVKEILRLGSNRNKLFKENSSFFVLCTDDQLASINKGDSVWFAVYNGNFGYALEDFQIELVRSYLLDKAKLYLDSANLLNEDPITLPSHDKKHVIINDFCFGGDLDLSKEALGKFKEFVAKRAEQFERERRKA